MLNTEDKKWLSELFDKRFAEQDEKIEKRFTEQDERIEKRFTEQDEKIDKRFAQQDRTLAQMRKESRNQFDLMMEAMYKHAEELRKETDVRFAALMAESHKQNELFTEECLKRIDRKLNEIDDKFADHERHMQFIIENTINARLDAFFESLPGAYKTYENLESRVDKVEMRQHILERTVMDHIQEEA